MSRQVFYSFHYDADCARVGQVRNMGVVAGRPIASDNDWETIKRGGDAAIQRWIESQMQGTDCCVVLIGSNTANRKWVTYEIVEAWNRGKGVLGVYIHGLRDLKGQQSTKGSNPMEAVTHNPTRSSFAAIVKTYDPPHWDSKLVYAHISNNLAMWIEEAIAIRRANN